MASVKNITVGVDHECDVCSKKYKFKGHLLRHKAREHFDAAREESFLVRATRQVDEFRDILIEELSLAEEDENDMAIDDEKV